MMIKNRESVLIKGILCFLFIFFCMASLLSCANKEKTEDIETPVEEIVDDEEIIENKETEIEEETVETVEIEEKYQIDTDDPGYIVSYASEDHYRYGPSIMKYSDGSMDAWFSSPGNSGSQWDWITYRHSEDGINWSQEKIVLKPTPGSKDQCSVCDPGVIYFNDYYYLAYTATDYYEGQGSYNMAFVARSSYPDGPFEKWNGSGWGGDPEPIIFYDGGKDNWGIGEVSFVLDEEDLYIYYSYIDVRDTYIGLCKADPTDDWPATIRDKGAVLYQLDHDSVEIVYDENRESFFAFTINGRLLEGSKLVMYESKNGKDFHEVASVKEGIEDYAHNLGVSKSEKGWIDSSDELLIGYAYGKKWGSWDTRFQYIRFSD